MEVYSKNTTCSILSCALAIYDKETLVPFLNKSKDLINIFEAPRYQKLYQEIKEEEKLNSHIESNFENIYKNQSNANSKEFFFYSIFELLKHKIDIDLNHE